MTDLVNRLRIKAGMIEMGEMIAWGSDSALMREAANALEMAAPAVQGEPVAYAVFADNGNIRIWCADPIQAETLRLEYGEALQPLYTAPQPAEQHPEQHDTKGSRKALGAMNAKLRAKVGRLERELAAFPAQQSAPDVAQMVEALEECAASLAWNCFGECRAIHDGPIMPASGALEMARKALADYHKQGGEA